MKSPFIYFGGKRRVADQVWAAMGDVDNYVEPFAGSLAVLLARPSWHKARAETVNDADSYLCVGPATRILRADLTWDAAERIHPGDELLAFDEFNGPAREGLRAPTQYRRWKQTTVLAVERIRQPSYRLTFDDGTTVVASENHMWLGGSHRTGGRGWRWQTTKGLVCNRATQRSWILKLTDVVDPEDSRDAGWLAGFYDGEGNLSSSPGWRVTVAQKLGPELDRAEQLLKDRGFVFHRHMNGRGVAHVSLSGGMREVLRFLMLVRPERLIRNFGLNFVHLASLYGRSHQAVGLVNKEYLGEQEVIAISTTSRTFVAEGLASHNSNFWRALAHDPEGVAAWADWPVNETDLFARHLWLVNEGRARIAAMEADPDFYDIKVAGWWVWGINAWIGSGWCSGTGPWTLAVDDQDGDDTEQGDAGRGVNRQLPHLGNAGQGVNRQRPHLGDAGQGVNRKRPHLGNAGQGVNRQRPHLGDAGRGELSETPAGESTASFPTSETLLAYMCQLAERLRNVRVCCGDWSRVVTNGALNYGASVGVFLDPPYLGDVRTKDLYTVDDDTISIAVRDWAVEHGDDPRLRIVLAGYIDEHDGHIPDTWRLVRYSASLGYGTTNGGGQNSVNRHKEALWFSPHCLTTVARLFELPA